MNTRSGAVGVLSILFCFQLSIAKTSQPIEERSFGQSNNLVFIENAGQITDQHYTLRKDIDYKLNAPGIDIFVGDGQLHYQWTKVEIAELLKDIPGKRDEEVTKERAAEIYRMDVILVGANTHAKVTAEDRQEYYERYYLAFTPEEGVQAHSYKKITYRDIYPHIDWVLYIAGNQLKYDFVVHPGGNPKDIRIKYEGATQLQLKDGALTATTPFGSITEQKPYSYEAGSKKEVPSAYQLQDDILSFEVGSYTGELVMDPQLDWATYYGGSGIEQAYCAKADNTGNVYLGGQTTSSINIATLGGYQINYAGNNDAFLVKFNIQGIRLWATYFGGTGGDRIFNIANDATGMIYITGETSSASAIATAGGFQTLLNNGLSGTFDAFLVKFNTNGVRQWGTYYGGQEQEHGYGVTVDQSGNIYLSGFTASLTGIATPGSHQASFGGYSDVFLAKFSTAGTRLWATYYGGTSDEYEGNVACDNIGNVYLLASTNSLTNIGTPGAYQSGLGGYTDMFLAKFNTSGIRQWGTYFGGPGQEYATAVGTAHYGIAVDASGFIYISGSTNSTAGIATTGASQPVYGGGYRDGCVAKFDGTGLLQWATYCGGNDEDYLSHVSVSATGMVQVAGYTASTSGIAGPGSYQASNAGGLDVLFATFNNAGVRQQATYYGSTSDELSFGTTSDNYGSVYIHGLTQGTNNIATAGAYQTVNGGGYDAILIKWVEDTAAIIQQPFLDTLLCKGQALQVSYSVSYTFKPGNVFTVQLSDATGSFATPVTIGTVVASAGGVINCVIPAGTPAGAAYRIRIVATNPARTAADNGVNIHISDYPTVTAASNSPVCGNTINLMATGSISGLSYTWSGPASFTSNQQNPSVPVTGPNQAGDYIVTADNYGCTARDTATIAIGIVNPSITNNSPLCMGGTLQLTASTITTGVTYSWTGPNGFTSNQQNPSIANVTALANGAYTLVITSPLCTSTLTTNVTVSTLPAAPSAASNSPVCEGQTINLTATNAIAGAIYNWSGPGSYSSNLQNPMINNATPSMNGTYQVSVSIGGCTSTASTTNVVVNPVPANPQAGSNTPLCVGSTLHLTSSTTTPGVSYSWTGPNGFTSNLQNPSIANVTTGAAGFYHVTITGPLCSSALTTYVSVNNIPAVPATGSNSPVCAGQSISLTANSTTPGVTYSWTGPGSYSANLQNPIRTNATTAMSGTYSVIASQNGCTSSAAVTNVTVNPAPVNLTAGSNSPVCAGNTINLSASNTTSSVTYTWAGPNSFTSNQQNPTIAAATTAMAGVYTVTGQLGSCAATATTTVIINPTPAAPAAGSNTPVCAGQTINLNALSTTPGVTYSWTGPASYTSALQNPVRLNATTAMSGTYNVVATLSGCSSPAAATTVVVNAVPLAPVASNNGPLCAGTALDLFATGTPGATYQWSGPAGYNSTAQNPTILNTTTAQAGSYTVTQTANGCTSAAATTGVVINNLVNPVLAIFPSPNDTICPGQTVVFVASPNNSGTAPQYQWKRNGNNITGATAASYSTAAINSGDYFSCQLTSNATCAVPATVQSNNILMTVEPPQPCVVNITANPGLVLSPWQLVTFTATPVKGGLLPSYQWLRNGQQVIGAISNTWSANNLSDNDTISVVLFSTDPCALPNTDTSNIMVVHIKTGITGISNTTDLVLYPNPNKGDFTIKGTIAAREVTIQIVNALGQLVYNRRLAVGSGSLDEPVHLDGASGVYLLKLVTEQGVQVTTFRVNKE